ncbi:hypothetical protein [Mucilaginibacter polytrichastri]|nr:hypothetical protein [Mucilaginibacter polytrichastri]SFS38370.1 hypothetical protein SAMN04487890_101185 [Mucilaginibacter polytrichastri]
MRISTILIIVVTVLLTIVIMQNTDQVKFTILFTDVFMPKVVMLTLFSVVAFILGILVGRPRKVKRIADYDYDKDEGSDIRPPAGTLSDEDRDYIS